MSTAGKKFRRIQPSTVEQKGLNKEKPEPKFFGEQGANSFFQASPNQVVHRQEEPDKKEDEKVARQIAQRASDENASPGEEKKDDEKLNRFAEENTEPKQNISGYIQNISNGGEPLPRQTQTFFSRRFGYNFKDIKIHNNSEASDSARQIKAKAYTVGKNIVFNKGEYNPDTKKGQSLIAHELAHVVQNSPVKTPGKIHRVPEGFEIGGIYPNASSYPNTIFFDLGKSSVPSSEMGKIPAIAAPPTRNITLIGTASEEGGSATNLRLINRRIRSVDRRLRNAGHTGARTHTPQASAGTGNIDYRRVRAVEVIPTPGVVPPGGAMPISTPSCETTATNPNPEVASCGTSFVTSWPTALNLALNAYIRMSMYDMSSIIQASILFPGIHFNTIINHLRNIYLQISRLPFQHQCHNECDGGCMRPAYNNGVGSSSMMTLCPDFISMTNQTEQAEYLIHESVHATPGLATEDTAYYTTRLISNLTGTQALNNTDSFVLLILRINGIAPPGGVAGSDSFTGGLTTTETEQARHALSYLEQWLLNAEFDSSLLYTAIHETIGSTSGWHSDYEPEAEIAHALSPLVGITDPGSSSPFTVAPVKQDKEKVAGMYHRYTTIINEVYLNTLTVNKISSGTEQWDMAANTVHVLPTFFAMSPENKIKHLLRLLIVASGLVPRSLVSPYIESANEIRKLRSTGP